MKAQLLVAGLCLIAISRLAAIPQNFSSGGFIGNGFGPDLFGPFVNAANWENDGKKLPGEWEEGAGYDGQTVRYLKIHPPVLGQVAQRAYTISKGGELQSLNVNFLDAGSYFGYRPNGTSAEDDVIPLREKQRIFEKHYKRIDKELRELLGKVTKDRGEEAVVGRTVELRSSYLDFPYEEFVVRYAASENHSINLVILKKDAVPETYLDSSWQDQPVRELRERAAARVKSSTNGDVQIEGIPVFRQGARPYCAVNTIGMVTTYFGLQLSVESLAAGAQMKNTGSAAGSKMLEMYAAAAEEAGLKSSRSGRFDFKRAMKAIEDGFPVIVWRRYDSGRDRLHTEFARTFSKSPAALLPEATADERATWPNEKGPSHASIVTGFNAERGEVIFMESWGEHTRNRRMRFEEMEATSYMAFYFKM